MQIHGDATLRSDRDDRSSQGRLLIVSNRGPVEYTVNDVGELEESHAGGGLATTLATVAKSRPVTWIASAVTAADRMVAADGAPADLGEGKQLRLVAPATEAYDLFYSTFCNPFLWFLQHSLWHQLRRTDPKAEVLHAWERGYLPVNQAFGQAVVEALRDTGGTGQVMLHDYHLYLAPRFIRNQAPKAILQHFVHIPWPHPDTWQALPRAITESICEGLLANDSIVFQTQESVKNFTLTCRAFLSNAHVTFDGGAVLHQGRRTRVWANPVSVDVSDLRGWLSSPEAGASKEKLASEVGERTIVRVDRLDPSKNIVAGFQAFDLLLNRHPEWAGRVKFLAFLVPSRTSIPEYRAYTKEVFAQVEEINARHARSGWTPITVFHEHNRLQALVAMSLYDVLLVNPLRDGMNLISKEGPVVNQRDGVLVLSVSTGSYAELRDGVLSVQPEDITGTAEALHTALSLPAVERRERAMRLRQAVSRHDLNRWLRLQLEDLNAVQQGEPLDCDGLSPAEGGGSRRVGDVTAV